MKVVTARWVAGGVAAVSVALLAGGLVLAVVDRHRVSAGLTGWDDVFTQVTDLALPPPELTFNWKSLTAPSRFAGFVGFTAMLVSLCGVVPSQSVLTLAAAEVGKAQIGFGGFL